jgi:translocator protein
LKTNKQISELYPTLVTPAGWAFAIWGVIFTLEGLSVFWFQGSTPLFRACAETGDRYWICACICQTLWTMAFALNKIPLAQLLMAAILVSIFVCYNEYKQCLFPGAPISSYLLGVLPYCLHSAWLCTATLASVNISAVYFQVPPAQQLTLAWVTACTLVVVAVGLGYWYNEPVFALVCAWSLSAISSFVQPDSLQRAFTPADRSRLTKFARLCSGGLLANGILHAILLTYWSMNQ